MPFTENIQKKLNMFDFRSDPEHMVEMKRIRNTNINNLRFTQFVERKSCDNAGIRLLADLRKYIILVRKGEN